MLANTKMKMSYYLLINITQTLTLCITGLLLLFYCQRMATIINYAKLILKNTVMRNYNLYKNT